MKRTTKHFPLPEEEITDKKNHLIMAWVLGDIRDPLELMSTHLLASVLLENSASELRLALETTELGSAPSPLCGVDDTGLEMVFVCGIEGAKADSMDSFEELVIETLTAVVEKGIEHSRLTALLDQLELQQREIGGSSYPYGLQIMLSCLPTAIHRGDAAAALDIDPILAKLRCAIEDPAFIKQLISRLLLNNQHRVSLLMSPDGKLSQRKIDQEKAKLSSIKSTLTEDQKQEIIATAEALKQRQNEVDDPEVLPKVDLDDIPPASDSPDFSTSKANGTQISSYPQATNGLCYQEVIIPLPVLNARQNYLRSIHNYVMTDLGVGSRDYLSTQNWQTAVCGGISCHTKFFGALDDEQSVNGHFILSSKGLNCHSDAISELLEQTHQYLRFDEQQRIRELIAQSRARSEQSVTGSGHTLAMSIATQNFSPLAKINHQNAGIEGIKNLKALDDSLDEAATLDRFCEELADVHQCIISNQPEFLVIGNEQYNRQAKQKIEQLWSQHHSPADSEFCLNEIRQNSRELWLCNSQVNFCAKAYQTVGSAHPDAPALTVLGGVLRNGFLHTAIREQGGAYGGGASQDSSVAGFRFYSYRDPRLSETLDDFDASIAWLLDNEHPWRVVEEAILGVISSLDKPSSPAGTAKIDFYKRLHGRTQEHQNTFRNAVLEVTQADLKRVTETYLIPEKASIGIITHQGEAKNYRSLCEDQGIRIQQL